MENNQKQSGKQIRVQFDFKGIDLLINEYNANDVKIISNALSGGILIWLLVAFVIIAVTYLGLDFLKNILTLIGV